MRENGMLSKIHWQADVSIGGAKIKLPWPNQLNNRQHLKSATAQT